METLKIHAVVGEDHIPPACGERQLVSVRPPVRGGIVGSQTFDPGVNEKFDERAGLGVLIRVDGKSHSDDLAPERIRGR